MTCSPRPAACARSSGLAVIGDTDTRRAQFADKGPRVPGMRDGADDVSEHVGGGDPVPKQMAQRACQPGGKIRCLIGVQERQRSATSAIEAVKVRNHG